MNDFVIETNDLTKCYGEQVCVAQLCLHVPKGKIYALLGRNGAGKTTTMKMLLNLVKPTSGLLKILYLIFDYPHKHYTFKYFEV